jgi:hypothetical protein
MKATALVATGTQATVATVLIMVFFRVDLADGVGQIFQDVTIVRSKATCLAGFFSIESSAPHALPMRTEIVEEGQRVAAVDVGSTLKDTQARGLVTDITKKGRGLSRRIFQRRQIKEFFQMERLQLGLGGLAILVGQWHLESWESTTGIQRRSEPVLLVQTTAALKVVVAMLWRSGRPVLRN